MTTISPTDYIDSYMLRRFEDPTCQPGEGTVEPFTSRELAAIAAFNEHMGGIIDSLLIPSGHPDPDNRGWFLGVNDAREAFASLRTWYEALDSLDADLRDGNDRHSNAALRLLEHEAAWLRVKTNLVQRTTCKYFLGADAYHPPFDDDSQGVSLLMSNGYITARSAWAT